MYCFVTTLFKTSVNSPTQSQPVSLKRKWTLQVIPEHVRIWGRGELTMNLMKMKFLGPKFWGRRPRKDFIHYRLKSLWLLYEKELLVNNMNNHHHHHHVALVARISLTLSRHSSLSFIALGRSSGQHAISSHSCWMYVRAGRPAFARPCVGVHKSTSLMSSSLLLQQCPACLVRLTWIVFVIGGWWPYSWCLVRCCRQDLFKIARSILV